MLVDLNIKFISKFNHGFTNLGCLHCAIRKALYGFKVKRAYKARDMQFFLQIVQNEIFKIWKDLKTTWNSPKQLAELTQKEDVDSKTRHSWYSYFVTIVGHYNND